MDEIQKFLRKIDARLRKRVFAALRDLEDDRTDHLDIVKLKGAENTYRCRIGAVRIIFYRIEGKNMPIHVEFRGSAHKH